MVVVPRLQEGGLRQGEMFGSVLLQPARSVCVSSERFFITPAFVSPTIVVNNYYEHEGTLWSLWPRRAAK